nr:uncharacterized protein LOC105465962 isoform X1 [Macaca nemestrina]
MEGEGTRETREGPAGRLHSIHDRPHLAGCCGGGRAVSGFLAKACSRLAHCEAALKNSPFQQPVRMKPVHSLLGVPPCGHEAGAPLSPPPRGCEVGAPLTLLPVDVKPVHPWVPLPVGVKLVHPQALPHRWREVSAPLGPSPVGVKLVHLWVPLFVGVKSVYPWELLSVDVKTVHPWVPLPVGVKLVHPWVLLVSPETIGSWSQGLLSHLWWCRSLCSVL